MTPPLGRAIRRAARQAPLAQPVRFALVGVANTCVDVVVFSLLTVVLAWGPGPANAVSYAAGTVNSYLLNRPWTFRASGSGRHHALAFALFAAINLGGLVLFTALVVALSRAMPVAAAKAVTVALVFFYNFLLVRRLVFV